VSRTVLSPRYPLAKSPTRTTSSSTVIRLTRIFTAAPLSLGYSISLAAAEVVMFYFSLGVVIVVLGVTPCTRIHGIRFRECDSDPPALLARVFSAPLCCRTTVRLVPMTRDRHIQKEKARTAKTEIFVRNRRVELGLGDFSSPLVGLARRRASSAVGSFIVPAFLLSSSLENESVLITPLTIPTYPSRRCWTLGLLSSAGPLARATT
jgi:hypothetical protein